MGRPSLIAPSHSAARVLPTIRSRCRLLALRPLAAEDVARAKQFAKDMEPVWMGSCPGRGPCGRPDCAACYPEQR